MTNRRSILRALIGAPLAAILPTPKLTAPLARGGVIPNPGPRIRFPILEETAPGAVPLERYATRITFKAEDLVDDDLAFLDVAERAGREARRRIEDQVAREILNPRRGAIG
jgi:hypothetical protein